MKIAIWIIVFCSVVLNASMQKVSLQLLWKHQFEFAGFYIAKEKGFYKDVGLDVELKEYEFGTNIAKDVAEGKSDFGVDSSSLILDKINGLDVYLLLPVFQNAPFVLMSKQREDIKTVADLKGKNIMVTPNQVTMASLNAMLKINSVTNDSYTHQEHSFDVNDLISGKTDAMSTYISNEPFYMIEKDVPYTIFNPVDFGFNFYDNIVFTSQKLYDTNPKMVKDFYEASLKGWKYAFEHIDETVDVILQNYNTQKKSAEHLKYEAQELLKLSKFGNPEYGKFKKDILNQIIQTYNLLDVTHSTMDVQKIIYPEAMYEESFFDYTLLWKILGVIALLFVGFYYWNRKLSKLNRKIELSRKKITTLLDNAGQGFLTFDKNFVIDSEYSKECIKIFGKDIASKVIYDLLFDNTDKKEIFKTALLNAQKESMEIKRNSYLSLLPSFIILNKKALKLEYKILEDSFMLIVTNITSEKKLENRVKKEQEILKMIVTIVSEPEVFYDVKAEYTEFINSHESLVDESKMPLQNITNLYRVIHTFKGSFAQLYMQDIVNFLHKLETELSKMTKDNHKSNEALLTLLRDSNFHESLDNTLKTIIEILGEEFISSSNYLKIDLSNIQELQTKIAKVLNQNGLTTPECQEILCQVRNLSCQKLINLLKPFERVVSQLANKMEKEIYDMEILGDKDIIAKESVKPFVKSLIHVFRNSLDHGIETPDEREEIEKDEKGTISCSFELTDDTLEIVISDDGRGIDKDKIIKKLNKMGKDTTKLSDKEIFEFIFDENFSTKENVTEISGRGVGMNALKHELDKIGGKVDIVSSPNEGTTFIFTLPYDIDKI